METPPPIETNTFDADQIGGVAVTREAYLAALALKESENGAAAKHEADREYGLQQAGSYDMTQSAQMTPARLVMEKIQDLKKWQARAACRGPQSIVFFPPSHYERKDEKNEREDRAKAICMSCSIRAECLDFALTNREKHGVWGGLTVQERDEILRERGQKGIAQKRKKSVN